MKLMGWNRSFLLLLAPLALLTPIPMAESQGSAVNNTCGKTEEKLDNAIFLIAPPVMLAVTAPPGWGLYENKKNPFFFLMPGDKYETARTVMYVRIQRLDDSLQNAIERDARTFNENCQPSKIEDVAQIEIMEKGCERKTQLFFCGRKQEPLVDMDTKIAIGDILLNVVLSSDSVEEISRYKKDYEFLLKHLALANQDCSTPSVSSAAPASLPLVLRPFFPRGWSAALSSPALAFLQPPGQSRAWPR